MRTTKGLPLVFWAICSAVLVFASGAGEAAAQPGAPILYFSDIVSGPRTGSSDTSLGQTAGQDGAIVTIWGRNLENAEVYCNDATAATYYFRGNATQPANLYTFHKMQMISFQVSHLASDGAGDIYAVVSGHQSNPLPFTVRSGNILFVGTSGNDQTGNGSWGQPWQTIPYAVTAIAPGDIVYIGDGVNQTTESDASSAVNLSTDGTATGPKALVVYPGAHSNIGNTAIERAFYCYNWERDAFSPHWVIAKFNITTGQIGAPAFTGFRVVGNYITAPNGDGMDGAINAESNDVHVVGNELEQVGSINCSKLYHAVYAKGFRKDDPPRAPTESGREIAWNYLHDCNANRGINIYSEQLNAAFIERHSVHDNVIVNQRGDGIMLAYYVVGDNWIYNNLVIRAGLGPEWPDGESYHTGIRINTGHEEVTSTTVYCYNNTLVGCGWAGAVLPGETGHVLIGPDLLHTTVYFSNNVIYSTGQPYLAEESTILASGDHRNCWFGSGAAPAWDTGAIDANPQFINAAADDFQLQLGSLCIDAGLNLSSVVERDLLGAPRPQGSAPDLGAYEYSGAEPGPSPTPTPTAGVTPTPTVEPIRELIRSFYNLVLGREPEAGAVDAWHHGYFDYAANFNIDVRFIPREMARLFFLSQEYANRSRTDSEFITDCYQVFLNRAPTQTELSNWTSGAWNRSQVMTIFSESEEFANRIQAMYPGLEGSPARNLVTFVYIGLLDRLVDQSGLEYASGLFDAAFASGGIEAVRAQAKQMAREVIVSPEFLGRQPTTADYVVRFYRAFLGRFPNDSEIAYWTGELDSGRRTTDNLIDLFADSTEFTARLNEYFG